MSRIGRFLRRLRERKVKLDRRRGVAMIVVAVSMAVSGAVVADFSYNARVDLEAAANGRDQLRAEYLARSSVNLGRLLIKVQNSVLDKNRQFVGDVQIADFAKYIIKAFGGDLEEQAGLASMIGISTGSLKGVGVGRGESFDLDMLSEDGKLNLNCGGGFNDQARQQILYGVLSAMFWPPRYNRLFEYPDADGQVTPREDVAKAIIDWADLDEQRYSPPVPDGKGGTTSSSSGSEDYRYDASRDPFKAHNNFYDTTEEVNLVRGVSDEVWGSFGEMFTVYGGCKMNLGAIRPEHWPLLAAIVRAAAKDDQKNNPALADETMVALLSQQVMALAQLVGGFSQMSDFTKWITDPAAALKDMGGLATNIPDSAMNSLVGVTLDNAKLNNVLYVGPRRIWRLDAVGTVQRTREKRTVVRIRAIFDVQHYNQNTTSGDANDRQGTWVYWRQE